ncbi:MAG: AmmeMemoRadiSam system protein B [Nannocystales bacterium]
MAKDTKELPDDSPSSRSVAKPKLRRIERVEQILEGERVLILRDPMGVAESFALDAEFAPVLDLLDGTRTVLQVRQSLSMRGVLDLPADELAAFVDSLAEEGWLDDDRFRDQWADLHAEFLEEDPRRPRFAGVLYPEDPTELAGAFAGVLGPEPRTDDNSQVVGVMVPHGPLDLVGDVLAQTLVGLPPAEALDCVVILGTDHGPGLLPFAAACRGFETPLGPVPAHMELLEGLDQRLEWAFREEVRHRSAHSIELSAVTLRALYGDAVPPIVPVLCGAGVLRARDTEAAERFIDALEQLLLGKRVLLWGSAELSHGGVAYGRPALDDAGAQALEDRDRDCLEDLIHARHSALARKCTQDHPQGRPSGGAVLSTLRQLLPEARVEVSTYRAASIDPVETTNKPDERDRGRSFAGLAGVRLFARP